MILEFNLKFQELTRQKCDPKFKKIADYYWGGSFISIYHIPNGIDEFTKRTYMKHFLEIMGDSRAPSNWVVYHNTVLILSDPVHEFFESHGKRYSLSYVEKEDSNTKVMAIEMDDDFGLYFKMAYL